MLLEGDDRVSLESVATALCQTLNCHNPRQHEEGPDACDRCESCRRVEARLHTDIQWVRPESKTRVIRIEQMREVMHSILMKPVEGKVRCTVISGADRMNPQAANAFLKTLEEPPVSSVILLLTSEPQRLLDTIRSRCVRVRLSPNDRAGSEPEDNLWLQRFVEMAAEGKGGLLGRYRLLGVFLEKLGEIRSSLEKSMAQDSPLERYDEVDPETREQWETELEAAVESEYQWERGRLLRQMEWWLRDVWLVSGGFHEVGFHFREWEGWTCRVGSRLQEEQAAENLFIWERLQRHLGSNVQESLAIEVGLLKLKL